MKFGQPRFSSRYREKFLFLDFSMQNKYDTIIISKYIPKSEVNDIDESTNDKKFWK